jgi:ABC-2 type transport system permease protein
VKETWTVIWTLAGKELRLLLRDRLAAFILLVLPLVFVLVLGLLLGEGFGQKPDDRLRISLVDLDAGYVSPGVVRDGMAWLTLTPTAAGPAPLAGLAGVQALRQANRVSERLDQLREGMAAFTRTPLPVPGALPPQEATALTLAAANRRHRVTPEPWSQVVQRDLRQTGGIRVEIIPTRAEAERLVRDSQRAAVLVFGPDFSDRVQRSSFLADGLNPFYRDGVRLRELDVEMLRDPTQLTASSIIEQVAQVSLLRVILPWMIGRAFERLSENEFIERLGSQVRLPVPRIAEGLFALKRIKLVDHKASLNEALAVAAPDERALEEYRTKVGQGVQTALSQQFSKYNLTGKTWAKLTQSEPHEGGGPEASVYQDEGGLGVLHRGAVRYQILVPSYTVTFAFFLVLTVSWLFVTERRQGTLKRLRAAPLSRSQILLGKFVPCYALSVGQGLFLLGAGKLVFGMNWGVQPLWLVAVVVTTSLAAMGLALLVASVARTELQVAIFGTLLVLGLALVSGCLLPRDLMPEEMRKFSLLTPHAWSLDAYLQLLLNPEPELSRVLQACAVLTGFGTGFVALAWWLVRLD